jgi:hypothetical protein
MKYVLYNAAHANTNIVSDGDAWIRVLGFFKSKETALSQAKKICAFENQEIRICPVGEFRMVMRSVNREAEVKKHKILMETHANKRMEAFAETRKNAEDHKMGQLKFSPRERTDALSSKVITGGLKKIPADLELRMQKFAAVALVPDYEHEKFLEAKAKDWEEINTVLANKQRNSVLIENLKGRNFPKCKDLMEKWVEENPPPAGFNVYGQKEEMWTKTSDPSSTEYFVVQWLSTFMKEFDSQMWKWLGIERPSYNPTPAPDMTGDEPAIAFLFAGNTEEEVQKFIGESSLSTYDIACVTLYEWIRVIDFENIDKTYREPMLELIHENKRLQAVEASKLSNSKIIEISG